MCLHLAGKDVTSDILSTGGKLRLSLPQSLKTQEREKAIIMWEKEGCRGRVWALWEVTLETIQILPNGPGEEGPPTARPTGQRALQNRLGVPCPSLPSQSAEG